MARIADRKENQPVFASVRCPVHGLEHIFLVRKLLMAADSSLGGVAALARWFRIALCAASTRMNRFAAIKSFRTRKICS